MAKKYLGSDIVRSSDNASAFGGSGSLSLIAVDCDFGATGAQSKTFDVAHTGALAESSKILASMSGTMPAGVAEDELEMDPIAVHGWVPADNVVRLRLTSAGGGTIYGARRALYALA